MQDLNDLYYFAEVVEHGGFAPAGRALGIPKSTLSRRVSLLEGRLGVRLIQRSTRQFSSVRGVCPGRDATRALRCSWYHNSAQNG